jgi:hypothetical protein
VDLHHLLLAGLPAHAKRNPGLISRLSIPHVAVLMRAIAALRPSYSCCFFRRHN